MFLTSRNIENYSDYYKEQKFNENFPQRCSKHALATHTLSSSFSFTLLQLPNFQTIVCAHMRMHHKWTTINQSQLAKNKS